MSLVTSIRNVLLKMGRGIRKMIIHFLGSTGVAVCVF